MRPDRWRRFGGASFSLSLSEFHARLYLTAREYDALLKHQHGKCCVRGCRATEAGVIWAHPARCAGRALVASRPRHAGVKHRAQRGPSGVDPWHTKFTTGDLQSALAYATA